jgi:tetratricopeptide (TPR) repeat protein
MGIFNLFGARKKIEESRQLASLGVAMYQTARFDEAINLFDRAIEIGGETPEILFQRGLAYSKVGQLSAALRDFYDAILARPSARLERDVWYNLGKANAELEDLQESIQCYENAIRRDPQFAQAYCNLGGVRLRLGEKDADLEQYEQALCDLDQGLLLNPEDALGYYNRATANSVLKNYDRIDADLQRFLKLAPPDHPYVSVVTKLLAASDTPAKRLYMLREQEQEHLWQKIIEANNNSQSSEAIMYCDKLLQINPRQGKVWDEKAFALRSLQRMKDALDCCEEGIAHDPNAVRLYYTHGRLLYDLKRYREALGAFEKYVALAPPEYADVVATAKVYIRELCKLLEESAKPT